MFIRLKTLGFLSSLPLRRCNHSQFSLRVSKHPVNYHAIVPQSRATHRLLATFSASTPTHEVVNGGKPSQAALIALIKQKGAQKAVRKIVSTVEEAEAGKGEWGNAGVYPNSTVYNTAIRALIRAERPDLACALFQARRTAQTTRPDEIKKDPNLAAAIIRSALRDSNKRSDRLTLSQEIFNVMKDDFDLMLTTDFVDKEILERDVPRFAMAFANLVSAFLDAIHKGNPVKDVDMERGNDALNCVRRLSEKFGKLAALNVKEYNELIRIFGKGRMLSAVFNVLDIMRICQVPKDNVTFEYIANAAVRQVRFVTGAVSMQTLPEPLGAEVAFVGRSNVGKSSLVNMVCNRRTLAYVSGRPGKTQQFNYFLVNENDVESQFYLVDLPGVGYAKVPKHIQEEWMQFMHQYFRYRISLRAVFHLVDGRHGALVDDELLMTEMSSIRGAYDYIIVLTKMDKTAKQKAKQSVIDSTRAALRRNGCSEDVPILSTSAESKQGRDEMWWHLQHALREVVAKKGRRK